MAYCTLFSERDHDKCKEICQDFVDAIIANFPALTKKVKIHLLLHLPDCMLDFGPTSAYNTER